jgi:hypothetical protein
MTFAERVQTVLSGGIPDRVPCIPLLYYFPARFAGVPVREFMTGMRAYRRAMDICFHEVGPFDAMYPLPFTMDAPGYRITCGAGVGMIPVLPGDGEGDLQVMQFPESQALMTGEDYGAVLGYDFPGPAYPLLRFMVEMVSRLEGRPMDARFWLESFIPALSRLGLRWIVELERWRARGIPFFISFSLEAPFDTFSMARGLVDFSLDLRRRGELVRDAANRLAASMAWCAALACRATRVRRFLLLLHRTSNDFISPKQFEELAYPSIKLIAEYLDERDIVFGMHCDGNWDGNLEVMTDLPRNSYFQFDGTTDIFRARRVLGDGFTIMGDVPASMLAFGSAGETSRYCERLISEVGAEGRFILSSGCEVPGNAKPENVRAMVHSARTVGRYRG